MGDSARKVVVGLFLLVLLWIGVYWWWPADPPITTIAPVSQAPLEPARVEREKATEQPATVVEPPTLGVLEPQFRSHVVARGDTLEAISTKYFGTPEHAGAIARANPLMSPARLTEGRTIRVPMDPANVQGVVVGDAESTPDATAAADVSEYVVQKGDSLARIARRLYDDESLADMIYQANRDKLTSPERIRVGQTLRIPAKPVKKPSEPPAPTGGP